MKYIIKLTMKCTHWNKTLKNYKITNIFYVFKYIIMPKLSIIISLLFLFISSTFSYQTLINKTLDNHNVKIIKVLLNWQQKIVVSTSNKWTRLNDLMNKVNGVSAINWAYFCPADYKSCGWINYTNVPRFVRWQNISKYGIDFSYNWVFSFDKEWKPFIVMNQLWWYAPEKLKWYSINKDKISNIYYWLWNFPVLLLNWKDILYKYKWILSRKMKNKGTKSFICFTKNRKTIYMGYISNIGMYNVPTYIKNNFWCYSAINLDAGASLWMVYNKKIIKKTWRPIMDAFVVVNTSYGEKYNYYVNKYSNLINKVVNKIKEKYLNNEQWFNSILKKIDKFKIIYKRDIKIYAVLNELENRLESF